jgi:carbonic anhydrase/acetyltransferase-like protein (isoleucine patch superfamily)
VILEHRGARPTIDPSAYVAPTAVVCGDAVIGAGARVLFGAVLSAEDGRVEVGRNCMVMENALVRGRAGHPALVGDDVLIGPHAHVNSVLEPDTVVPIGWIAAGDPAQLFAPGQHEELWALQRELDFPGAVYGVERGTPAAELMARQSEFFGAHREDRECG